MTCKMMAPMTTVAMMGDGGGSDSVGDYNDGGGVGLGGGGSSRGLKV